MNITQGCRGGADCRGVRWGLRSRPTASRTNSHKNTLLRRPDVIANHGRNAHLCTYTSAVPWFPKPNSKP